MSRIALLCTLLLLAGLDHAAAGDQGPKDTSGKQKAEKISAYLKSIGITDPRIHEFTATMGDRVEGKRLRITEHYFDEGRVVLFYQARPKVGTKLLELKFQPVDYPNTEFIATTKSVMIQYKYNF